MLDKFTEKMLENVMSGYRPRLEEISKMRVDELVAIKAKVRTHPEEVEAWFDTEITKAGSIDVSDILKKMKLQKHVGDDVRIAATDKDWEDLTRIDYNVSKTCLKQYNPRLCSEMPFHAE